MPEEKKKLLIVEDDTGLQKQLKWTFDDFEVLQATNRQEALAHLRRTEMDNGLACESVNETTGVCETGEAFATCAGFLAYSLWTALRKSPDDFVNS